MDWLKLGFRRWSDFSGRSKRPEYLALMLFYIIAATLTGVSVGYINPLLVLIAIPIWLALTVLLWGVAIRRLHDINLPGILLLIGVFIPGFNALLLLLLAFIPGTAGENNYGDDAGEPADYLGMM